VTFVVILSLKFSFAVGLGLGGSDISVN